MDENWTRKVGHLAQLELSESEVKAMTSQIGNILKYFEKLQRVDVTGVEPMTHPLEHSHVFREDVVRPSLVDSEGRPKVLTSAPDTLNNGYKVPQIL